MNWGHELGANLTFLHSLFKPDILTFSYADCEVHLGNNIIKLLELEKAAKLAKQMAQKQKIESDKTDN